MGRPRRTGWFKAILGTMAGLFSGAFLMYVSPLVDSVVKPDAPLANFDTRRDGLTVTFHNLSAGPRSMEGWWDFGDGSPLQPLVPDTPTVAHTYPRPGGYTARLILRNALGETNERSVNLQLDATTDESPRIQTLQASPIAVEPYAPATFRVTSEISNAQLCVWDLDEGRPLEITAESPGRQERLVTFPRPGGYVVKLAAVRGTKHEQRSVVVNVLEPPTGSLAAVLTVTDRATAVEREERPHTFSAAFPADVAGDVFRFTRTVPARPGFTIADVRLAIPNAPALALGNQPTLAFDAAAVGLPQARNLVLQRDPGGVSARLTGDLVRLDKGPPPGMVLPVVLMEERRRPVSRPPVSVMAAVSAPGKAELMMPPMPAGWENPTRLVRFELRDGNRVLWQGDQLPQSVGVAVGSFRHALTARPVGDKIQVSLSP